MQSTSLCRPVPCLLQGVQYMLHSTACVHDHTALCCLVSTSQCGHAVCSCAVLLHAADQHHHADTAPWAQTRLAPGLVSALVQFANFERRQGQLAAAKALYEAFIEQEAAKSDSATHAFAVVQYAAFLQQSAHDIPAAQAAFAAALAKRTNAKALWEVGSHTCSALAARHAWAPCPRVCHYRQSLLVSCM